jgi:hypothetical protein
MLKRDISVQAGQPKINATTMFSIYKTLNKLKLPAVILISITTAGIISCNRHNKSSSIIAVVDYTSKGCFGGENDNLKIINADGEIRAILTISGAKYAATMDSSKLQIFNKFIKELKIQNFGIGCTTTSSYFVKIGDEEFEKKDDGCSWNGFDKLKIALFEQEIRQRLYTSE